MTQHTRGEWSHTAYGESSKGEIIIAGGGYPFSNLLAEVYKQRSKEEQEANAKLIAAAPDMLSVLKEAVDHAHVYDTNPALVELFEAVIRKTK
jgi:hypothetical protein